MIVLVDYANLPLMARSKGIVYIAERITQEVVPLQHPSTGRVRCRLYGGWYAGLTPTRSAQALATEIAKNFPRVVSTPPGSPGPFIVDMELAYSLEGDPATHLLRTYRRASGVEGIACRLPAAAGCVQGTCPLAVTEVFFRTGICPEVGCTVEPGALLSRREQKLIDTMLTTDLIHLARTSPRTLCLVSSDDDLWPAIKTALLHGRNVLHVHTIPGHRTHEVYARTAGSQYMQASL